MPRAPSVNRFLEASVDVALRRLLEYRGVSGEYWPCHELLVQSAVFHEYLSKCLTVWARVEASVRHTAKEAVGAKRGRPFVGGRTQRGRFDIVTFYTQSEDPRFVIEVKHTLQSSSADRDVKRIKKFSEYMRREDRRHDGGILLAYRSADQEETLVSFFSRLSERHDATRVFSRIRNAKDDGKRPYLGAAALFFGG